MSLTRHIVCAITTPTLSQREDYLAGCAGGTVAGACGAGLTGAGAGLTVGAGGRVGKVVGIVGSGIKV